ncbi:MAG: hypothetical protein KKA84_10205 [Bacteroidetes bacterium]|nr:hypothetical protein [Bacteroidota bacterium]
MKRKIQIVVIVIISFILQVSGQSIKVAGSIYEGEFTKDNKIAGLFTYMNNSDRSLILEIRRTTSAGTETVLSQTIATRRGKQIRVFEQEYSASESQVFGDYQVSFYVENSGEKGMLLFSYDNKSKFAPNLRVVSVMFSGVNDDDNGKYFEVRIDWQTIREGTETDIRKCYVGKL